MGSRRPWIANQRSALWLGVALSVAGAAVLWDAHEHRGKRRPFALRWIPGG